jgi:NADPH:quinone reductase-like Zn-dependent oxidoreductase
VIVTAASSSVGLTAIQLAKGEGATAIAATHTSKKREELRALGADHVIGASEEDLPKIVEENHRRQRQYVYDRLQDGRLHPKIARTFPFAQSADAYRYLESNEQIDKVVITI